MKQTNSKMTMSGTIAFENIAPTSAAFKSTLLNESSGTDDYQSEEKVLLSCPQLTTQISHGEESSICESQSSSLTFSSSGSFAFIKAEFLDEMNRLSIHRCEKRSVKAAIEPVDMIVDTDQLNHESFNSLSVDDGFGDSDDLSDASSATTSSFGSFSLIKSSFFDEAARVSNPRVKPLSPEVVSALDNSWSTSVGSSHDGKALITEQEVLLAIKEAKLTFEKSLIQTPKAEIESELVNTSNPPERKVSFNTVEVRQYKRIVGDHPSCTRGPSISIDWEHDAKKTQRMTVDDYEIQRCPSGQLSSMILSPEERTSILLKLGFSEKEIVRSIRRSNKDKKKRMQTTHNLHLERMEEAAEAAKRKIKNSLTRKKDLYKERELKLENLPEMTPMCATSA